MQGLGANTIYCGDGINDIAALAAADVGMAIGATDAVVAASLSTSRKSIAGHPGCNMCLCVCAALSCLMVHIDQPRLASGRPRTHANLMPPFQRKS